MKIKEGGNHDQGASGRDARGVLDVLVLPRPRVRQARSRHGGHAHRPDRHPEPHLAHSPSRRTPRQAPKAQPPNRPRLLRRDGRLRGSGAETRRRHRRRAEPRVRRGVPLPRPGPASPPHPATTPRRARGPQSTTRRGGGRVGRSAGVVRFGRRRRNRREGRFARAQTRGVSPDSKPSGSRTARWEPRDVPRARVGLLVRVADAKRAKSKSKSKSKRQIQSEGPAAAAAAQGGPVRAPAPDVLGRCRSAVPPVGALERPPASGGTRSDELGDGGWRNRK